MHTTSASKVVKFSCLETLLALPHVSGEIPALLRVRATGVNVFETALEAARDGAHGLQRMPQDVAKNLAVLHSAAHEESRAFERRQRIY